MRAAFFHQGDATPNVRFPRGVKLVGYSDSKPLRWAPIGSTAAGGVRASARPIQPPPTVARVDADLSDLEDPDGVDLWEVLRRNLPPLPPEDQKRVDDLLARARVPIQSGQPRMHHWLPQFYQRRFANDRDQLWVTPIDGSKGRLGNVTDIGVQRDLYTIIDKDVGESVSVEHLLASIDGDTASAFARLAARFFWPPLDKDRAMVAYWLAFQRVRDPFARRQMEAISDLMYRTDLKTASDPRVARERLDRNLGRAPSSEEVDEMTETARNIDGYEIGFHQNEYVRMMLDEANAMMPHFVTRFFTIFHWSEPGLVLCDRPVSLVQAEENRRPGRSFGVIDADEVLVPLDRETALILHRDPVVGQRIVDDPDGYSIDEFNQFTVSNTAREIYCHPEDVSRLRGLKFPEPDAPILLMEADPRAAVKADGVNAPPTRRAHRRYRRREH